MHKTANEKYALYCDEKAKNQQNQRENANYLFNNLNPHSTIHKNGYLAITQVNGEVGITKAIAAPVVSSDSFKIEICEEDIEEINSESSMTGLFTILDLPFV